MIVWFAVRMTVTLEEVSRAQLLAAMIARKVLRMPGLAQCGDHLTDDRLVTSVAASLLGSGYSLAAHIGL